MNVHLLIILDLDSPKTSAPQAENLNSFRAVAAVEVHKYNIRIILDRQQTVKPFLLSAFFRINWRKPGRYREAFQW